MKKAKTKVKKLERKADGKETDEEPAEPPPNHKLVEEFFAVNTYIMYLGH